MADIAERVSKAREHVAPRWTAERERLIRDRLDRDVQRHRRRRVLALALATFVVVAAGIVLWNRAMHRGGVATATVNAAPRALPAALLRLEDGSVVTATSADAQVEPVEIGARDVSVHLVSGSARFSVTPNPDRTFRVMARDVTVTVLGTIFTVGLEPGGVRVAVERGRVRVAWPSGDSELGVGEQTFVADEVPPAPAVSGAPPAEEVAAAPVNSAERPSRAARAVAEPSWRSFAEDGDYAHAFARMSAEGANAVRDEPGDLLLAADVARLGGHPEKAVPELERVVSAHPDDSRAPLAAFTLGRTFLDQLGRPREAAAAFATARKLDPHGALAQDALAREVEGWSRAGEASLARERADEYVKAYPNGRRLSAVKRLGGGD